MRRAVLALTLVAVTALGFIVFAVGSAEAWKCDRHPEQPTCTTTTGPPVTVNSTTSQPPVSVTQPNPTTSLPTTTTSSPPPEVTVHLPTVVRPPTPPRLAG